MKRREEAWVKLEAAAKRNPTFHELAMASSSSSSSSSFGQFGQHFPMIDEDGGGDRGGGGG